MKVYLLALSLLLQIIVLNHNTTYGNNILNVSVITQESNLGPQKSENDFMIVVKLSSNIDGLLFNFDGFYSNQNKLSESEIEITNIGSTVNIGYVYTTMWVVQYIYYYNL